MPKRVNLNSGGIIMRQPLSPTILRSRTGLAVALASVLTLTSFEPPARGQAVAAAGLGATLIKALPGVATVVKNLFSTTKPSTDQQKAITKMTTSTSAAMTDLKKYVKKEQILGTIVSASGVASASVAKMSQIVAGQSALTKAQIGELDNAWPDVTEALDNIAKAKPDTSVFDGDSLQIKVINNIISADEALKTKITAQLKYDPAKPDTTLLKNLQLNLEELGKRFQALSEITGIELKTVADGLAAATTSDTQPTDTKATKGAANVSAAFKGNISALQS